MKCGLSVEQTPLYETDFSQRKKQRHSDFEQYLSESGHRLAGDDLISAQTGDEAQGLVLVLPAFQLAQDQSTENLHVLQGTRDEQTE